jgi:flagellar biosynthesis protein FlhG
MSTVTPLAPRTNARPRGRNLIAIASGKGGVGKTLFAISLCHALARAGRKVLLFDGDLGLANVDIQLGLMPKHDLGAVIAGRLSLNQAILPFDDGGFDIISGRSGSGSLVDLPVGRLQGLGDDLTLMSANYDHIIIDLGAGVEKTVRALTNNVGMILVVTTDEPTSLTDAYAFIKVTHLDQPDADLRVVVNMANSNKEGERTYNTLLKACEGFLKISPQLAGVVRRDDKVRSAIRNQTPLLMRYPNTDAASDIESIANRLIKGSG